jgi:hypothetical protein
VERRTGVDRAFLFQESVKGLYRHTFGVLSPAILSLAVTHLLPVLVFYFVELTLETGLDFHGKPPVIKEFVMKSVALRQTI